MRRELSIDALFLWETAGLGLRMCAALLDYLFLSLLFKLTRAFFFPAQVDPRLLGLMAVLYLVITTGVSGQTLGKWALGLKVVDEEGYPPGVLKAMMRTVGYLLSLPFFVGFFWIRIDSEHRGWHDLIAGTRVVLV